MKKKSIIAGSIFLASVSCAPGVVNQKGSGNMRIVSATYGKNCGAPVGNVTSHVAGFCNDMSICEYRVDFRALGDPARGCAKDFRVEYRCGNWGISSSEQIEPEAGTGQIARLSCSGLFR